MAARTSTPTKSQQERTRAAIQTTQLVKRLQAFALGYDEEASTKAEKKPVELDGARLKAIEILLRKSLPDLSAISLTGGDGGPVQVSMIERNIVKTND